MDTVNGYPKDSLLGRSDASLFETYLRLLKRLPETLIDLWEYAVEASKILGFLVLTSSIIFLAPVSFILFSVLERNRARKQMERAVPGTFHRKFFVWVRTK